MKVRRRKSREVLIGGVKIGGNQPVSVQSMTKTNTEDVPKTVRQIKRLERAGSEIVRVAVKDIPAAEALGRIRKKINNIPLVADIHFHYRLALQVIAAGVDGIRLNPGNINKRAEIKRIVKQAKSRRISIRVGVNSGSLPSLQLKPACSPRCEAGRQGRAQSSKEKRRLSAVRYPRSTAKRMVNSARNFIRVLEDLDFYDIIVSLKASDITATVEAYRQMAELCDYPFHLGVTATGLKEAGSIKSAIAIGSLLLEGIGDTIRVSLTAPPEQEVKAGWEILTSLGLRSFGPEIISCPTCGRCEVDLIKIVREVSKRLDDMRYTCLAARLPDGQGRQAIYDIRPAKLAIMGCVVNGPGEAKDADLGIACGKGSAMLFRKGTKVKRVKEEDIIDTLLYEIENRQKYAKSLINGMGQAHPLQKR